MLVRVEATKTYAVLRKGDGCDSKYQQRHRSPVLTRIRISSRFMSAVVIGEDT